MSKEEAIEVEGTVIEPLPMRCFGLNWKMIILYWLISPVKCVNTLSRFCLVIRLQLSFHHTTCPVVVSLIELNNSLKYEIAAQNSCKLLLYSSA